MTVELVADFHNLCGEAPLWDFRRDRLVWTDLESNLVFEYDPASGRIETISKSLMVACIALNGENEFMFGGSPGLHLWKRDGSHRTLISEEDGSPLCFNEMLATPDGGIFANTMYWEGSAMQKTGMLYKFLPDGTMQTLDAGFELANGMGLSPDNKILYMTDSARRVIYAYDVNIQTGALSHRRVFVKIPPDEGLPDGLTVDAEGFVWSAQWYGSQVVRYDPDGKMERRISIPAKQVSSVNFGGAEMTDLYITTAAESWPSALMPTGYDPDSGNIGGALYRLRTEVLGKREYVAKFI